MLFLLFRPILQRLAGRTRLLVAAGVLAAVIGLGLVVAGLSAHQALVTRAGLTVIVATLLGAGSAVRRRDAASAEETTESPDHGTPRP